MCWWLLTMTRKTPALDKVSVRIIDNAGQTKAFFLTVDKFVDFVIDSNKSNVEPTKEKQSWYQRFIP